MSNLPISKDSASIPGGVLVIDRKSNGRAIYDAAAKDALVRHCLQPGVSVAGAALKAGVNANLLRKWMLKHQRAHGARRPAVQTRGGHVGATLVPVVLDERGISTASPPCGQTADLSIEIDGARIGVPSGFDQATLRAIVQILRMPRA